MDRALVAILVVVGAGLVATLLRMRRTHAIEQLDPADFGLGDGGAAAVVGFTSPMCHSCQLWREQLDAEGIPATFVDVKERPDLARRYRVSETPAVLLVDLPSGRVRAQYGNDPRPEQVAGLRSAVLAPR
jgi:hypothetical protein